jgi:hypothetical protein
MAFGLQIINDDNELLIDSEYVNPTFVQKLEFNTTESAAATYGDLYLHPGYVRKYYSTSTVYIGTGNYIVLWALPESIVSGQPTKDVWYMFPTSVAQNNLQFDCSVFSSINNPTTYTLPTAYIFTVDANGIEAMSSSGPALRMYNSATPQKKTFDSNFIQLAPYSISTNFSMPNGTNQESSSYIPTPDNPIYLLPKTALAFANQSYTLVNDIAFRRRGQYIDSKTLPTVYESEGPFAPGFTYFFAGTFDNLSVIVADANLYQASGGGTITPPTYSESLSVTSQTVSISNYITISITGGQPNATINFSVLNYGDPQPTSFPDSTTLNSSGSYSNYLTGGSISGGVVGDKVIWVRFPYSGNVRSIRVTVIADPTPTYSISPQTSSVNEGSSITFTVNTTSVATGTTLYWSINGGSANSSADFSANTGSFNISNNSGTFTVYPTADTSTEGSETFIVKVRTGSVSGTEVATTDVITINDTSIALYNEVISGPSSVGVGTGFTLTISGGAPNTSWGYNSGFSNGFGTLNGSGAASISVPGSAQPYIGTYTYDFYFTGSGNSRSKVVDAIQIYNESLSISPQTVSLSNYTTISITGGQPNATISYATANYGDPQPSSFPGSVSLNSSGNYSNYLTGGSITGGVVGDKTLWVYFPYSGNIRSARVNVVADAGQAVGGQYCVGYNLTQNYTNGTGGTYAGVVQYNSSSCGYNPPAAGQPVGSPYCVGYTRYQDYADGNYGTYAGVLEYNSTACGYTPPSGPVVSNYSSATNDTGNVDLYGTPSATYDGLRCRGANRDDVDAYVQRTFYLNQAATITAYLTVSSEANYDFGYMYFDGVLFASGSGNYSSGPISGPISAGYHTVKCRYTKDGSVTSGTDSAFVEYVIS